ncbi:Gfo/Idh/MocA family oxidoreductase [Nocardioides sp. GY 10113]|uniref:Gfo/Idh/MocA family protein n=1 Tax=Nocardioides sp. GY 10113 TaxID=2569761 RepID=UPI0010A7841A|nr:Gfo/Idh/MocA family oxidoreductase [Nocardioides sp. GY 10113]TIC81537.1 Gfo/Idh/MocA family oxidoreductase [Nocardioides sp. GY 10113]
MTTSLDPGAGTAGHDPAPTSTLRVAVVGVGKMGLSHLAILGAHPRVSIEVVCDSNGYVLDVLGTHTGMRSATDYASMLDSVELDAVVIATPTKAHYPMVRAALERGLHVFCEKPLTLSAGQSEELAALAAERGLTSQVGYHNRFVAAFAEAARLVAEGAIGTVHHALAEAYGPVVLKPRGGTWRSRRSEGGGCLYDYAAHPLDLLTWFLGEPTGVRGTTLGRIFSADTEDEVYATLEYATGGSAQLSVNWSDESYRKMTTRVTLWGTHGRITVDRQECQVYLRDTAPVPDGYRVGWNVKYTTELTPAVWFYVRGEEYSAELDYFVRSALGELAAGEPGGLNSFGSAAVADRVIEMLLADADGGIGAGSAAGTGSARGPAVVGPTRADRLRGHGMKVRGGTRRGLARIRQSWGARGQ